MMLVKRKDLVCSEIVELVTDYVEGALPGRTRRAVERHLAVCEGCSNYVEQMRVAIRLTGQPLSEPLSPRLERELVAAFRGFRG